MPVSCSSWERNASATITGSRIRPVHLSSRRSLLSSFICTLVSQVDQVFPESRQRLRRGRRTRSLQICQSKPTIPGTAACAYLTFAGIHAAFERGQAATRPVLPGTKFPPSRLDECHPASHLVA